MTWTPEEREKYFQEAVERWSDPAYAAKMRKREKALMGALNRMTEDFDALMEKYPEKWVAVGKDGMIAVGDSPDEVVQEVEDQGFRRWEYMLEHLETDPVPLIL